MTSKTLTRAGMDIIIKQYDLTYTTLHQDFDEHPGIAATTDEIILDTSEIPALIEKLQEYHKLIIGENDD